LVAFDVRGRASMIDPTSEEGRIGAKVRLRELDSVPDELQGLAGTITQSFGHQDPAAHEVGVDGGTPSCSGTIS
jgi:hypothetical protein